MLTSKERRDLEAYWSEERILRTAAVMKASMLLAALVGFLWIALAADDPVIATRAAAAPSLGNGPSTMVGISAIHARDVFDERRAQGTEDDMVPVGGLLGEDPYMTADSGPARPDGHDRDVQGSR